MAGHLGALGAFGKNRTKELGKMDNRYSTWNFVDFHILL